MKQLQLEVSETNAQSVVARDGPAAEELLLHGRGANDVAELCTRNATKWKPTEQFGSTTRLENI